MNQATDTYEFLGEEFLTWLWFRLETEGGEFDIGSGRTVAVSLDDLIAFAPSETDETELTLRRGLPSRTREAAAGLRNGLRVRRARLIVALGSQQWQLTLDGGRMCLTGVRLPEDDPEASDAAERSRERAANFLLLQEIVAQLYREFLRIRLRPDYLRRDAERQATWMATRRV